MLGKSMKILEVDKRSLMLSSSLTVVVAVNGSRKSNCALKWALKRFSDEGKVMFKLLHVRARITTVPTPTDGSTKYESSDTISCTDSGFTYDTSSQTGFGAWGCFAFGEDTKDIITTNLEKLLVAQVLLTLPFSFSQLGMLSGVLFQLFYGLLEVSLSSSVSFEVLDPSLAVKANPLCALTSSPVCVIDQPCAESSRVLHSCITTEFPGVVPDAAKYFSRD
ncbi:hypothetical protein Sjap_005574 [Stephania japonica]|uniref:Uncharacterized protein n=1 Tax=Stephania japonica TaxID=461633 RepID=A0AAP0K4I1_9MAGN